MKKVQKSSSQKAIQSRRNAMRRRPLLKSSEEIETIKKNLGLDISIRPLDKATGKKILSELESKGKLQLKEEKPYPLRDKKTNVKRMREVYRPVYELVVEDKTYYLTHLYSVGDGDRECAMLYFYEDKEVKGAPVYRSMSHSKWNASIVLDPGGTKPFPEELANLNYKMQIALDGFTVATNELYSKLDGYYKHYEQIPKYSPLLGCMLSSYYDYIFGTGSDPEGRRRTYSEEDVIRMTKASRKYNPKEAYGRFKEVLDNTPGLEKVGGYWAKDCSKELYKLLGEKGAYVVEVITKHNRRYINHIERIGSDYSKVPICVGDIIVANGAQEYSEQVNSVWKDALLAYYDKVSSTLKKQRVNILWSDLNTGDRHWDRAKGILEKIIEKVEKALELEGEKTGSLHFNRLTSLLEGIGEFHWRSCYSIELPENYNLVQLYDEPLKSTGNTSIGLLLRIRKTNETPLWVNMGYLYSGKSNEDKYVLAPQELMNAEAERLFNGNKEILEKLGF